MNKVLDTLYLFLDDKYVDVNYTMLRVNYYNA